MSTPESGQGQDPDRAIIEAELYWHGGLDRSMGTGACRAADVIPPYDDEFEDELAAGTDDVRVFRYRSDGEHWDATFDEA